MISTQDRHTAAAPVRRAGIILLALALTAAACGGDEPAPSTTAAPAPTTAAPSTTAASSTTAAPRGEVRIVSGQEAQNGQLLIDIFDRYNAQNTGVTVNLEIDNKSDVETVLEVQADILAGDPPDAVRVTSNGLRAFVDSGRAQPLDWCLESSPELLAELNDDLLGGFRVDGTLYGMPWYTTLPALYMNVDLFWEAGLDPANPPLTWTELEAAAAAVTATGPDRSGVLMYMPNTYLFEAQLESVGGAMVANGQAAVDSPESVRVMEFMSGLIEKGYMPAVAPANFWNEFGVRFKSGDLGMLIFPSSTYPFLTGGIDFEVQLAPMPYGDGGSPIANASANGFVMLSTDESRQAATCEALKTLVTAENVTATVMATATVPHNNAAATGEEYLAPFYAENPALVAVNDQVADGWYSLPGTGNPEFQDAFGNVQFEVLSGERSAQEALSDLAEIMNRLLADN